MADRLHIGRGDLFMRGSADDVWRHIGTTDPAAIKLDGPAADKTIGELVAGLPVTVTMPALRMMDIADALAHVAGLPGRRTLHVAPDVAGAQVNLVRSEDGLPWTAGMNLLLGIDVVTEGDMPPANGRCGTRTTRSSTEGCCSCCSRERGVAA